MSEMTIGERLVDYRARLNMHQQEFIDWLKEKGVTWNRTSLSNAELGKSQPDPMIWRQIQIVCDAELEVE